MVYGVLKNDVCMVTHPAKSVFRQFLARYGSFRPTKVDDDQCFSHKALEPENQCGYDRPARSYALLRRRPAALIPQPFSKVSLSMAFSLPRVLGYGTPITQQGILRIRVAGFCLTLYPGIQL